MKIINYQVHIFGFVLSHGDCEQPGRVSFACTKGLIPEEIQQIPDLLEFSLEGNLFGPNPFRDWF